MPRIGDCPSFPHATEARGLSLFSPTPHATEARGVSLFSPTHNSGVPETLRGKRGTVPSPPSPPHPRHPPRISCFFLLLAIALSAAGLPTPALAGPLDGSGYWTDRFSFDAGAGESVTVQYRLETAARVSVTAHDADHGTVAILESDVPRKAGVNAVRWDGRGASGERLPSGVYYFVIRAVGTQGESTIDPALTSGGEPLSFELGQARYDAGAKRIRFQIDRPAWVRIRAGVHEGPLLATPVDWEPFDEGEHSVPWDGRSDDGLLEFASHKKFSFVAQAFALPAGAVVLTGGEAAVPDALGAAKSGHPGDAARKRRIRETALRKRRIDPQYLMASRNRLSPEFSVSLGKEARRSKDGSVTADNAVAVTVELAPSSLDRMLSQRFEIVTYVDLKRIAEEEQGYSPYTVEVPVNTLAEGKHLVSVSVVSLGDQVATKSLHVQVQHTGGSQ